FQNSSFNSFTHKLPSQYLYDSSILGNLAGHFEVNTMIKILTSLCLLTVFAFPATASDDYTEELYELYCHSCHGVKGSGAPLAFNRSEWKPYLKKGINKLIDNAISGIG